MTWKRIVLRAVVRLLWSFEPHTVKFLRIHKHLKRSNKLDVMVVYKNRFMFSFVFSDTPFGKVIYISGKMIHDVYFRRFQFQPAKVGRCGFCELLV